MIVIGPFNTDLVKPKHQIKIENSIENENQAIELPLNGLQTPLLQKVIGCTKMPVPKPQTAVRT